MTKYSDLDNWWLIYVMQDQSAISFKNAPRMYAAFNLFIVKIDGFQEQLTTQFLQSFSFII